MLYNFFAELTGFWSLTINWNLELGICEFILYLPLFSLTLIL